MNVITILTDGRAWLARYTGPHAAEIIELFGQDIIPTAWTIAAPLHVVAAELARLNPDCTITTSFA